MTNCHEKFYTSCMEITMQTTDLLTFSEAARILGVSRPTVYNLIRTKGLHPVVIGRNRYLLRAEVEVLRTTLRGS